MPLWHFVDRYAIGNVAVNTQAKKPAAMILPVKVLRCLNRGYSVINVNPSMTGTNPTIKNVKNPKMSGKRPIPVISGI